MPSLQGIIRNELAEEEAFKAFRYAFRISFAGPLLAARKAATSVAGTCAVDFRALTEVIAKQVAEDPDKYPAVPAPCSQSLVNILPRSACGTLHVQSRFCASTFDNINAQLLLYPKIVFVLKRIPD